MEVTLKDIYDKLMELSDKVDNLERLYKCDLPPSLNGVLDNLERHISECPDFNGIISEDHNTLCTVSCSCRKPEGHYVLSEIALESPETYRYKVIFDDRIKDLNEKYVGFKKLEKDAREDAKPTSGLEL